MPIHTMTGLVLTAVAVLWPVIGLTVIGTVFLPLRALEMGHNAAVDLAAAVRWKPCNCNFPRLPFSPSPLNADMIIYELSEFHDPRALETWSPASARFQKYMVVNEKMRPPFVISGGTCFLADTRIYPTATFCCCWPYALRESWGLKSASISARTTQTQARYAGR